MSDSVADQIGLGDAKKRPPTVGRRASSTVSATKSDTAATTSTTTTTSTTASANTTTNTTTGAPARRGSRVVKKSVTSTSNSRASRLTASKGPSKEDLHIANERIAYLEDENSRLKEKMTLLRKAAAPMTRVVKPNTMPLEAKAPPPKPEPQRVDPRVAILQKQLKELEVAKQKREAELKRQMDKMEENFINKIDILRGQLADKTAQASAFNVDINRLTAELQRAGENVQAPDDSAELARLRARVRELEGHLQQALDEKAKVIEMGRKAEMTTIMFMQQNATLESTVQTLQRQHVVMMAAMEERGIRIQVQ